MTQRVVIVGNGIAGITAARTIRKRSDRPIVVVSSETDHFFSRTALMYIYMGHMTFEDTKPYADRFWADNRIELKRARVERIEPDAKRVVLDGGEALDYDKLVLATGSKSNKFGWPGQDLEGVQGLYGYPDLQRMERNTAGIRRGVVVGGGLIGVETAEMLHSRRIPVTMLVREASWMETDFPSEESAMINDEIVRNGIDLRLATELERIESDEAGRVRAVTTKNGEEIACGFVALTIGVSPNAEMARESGIECDRGILVDGQLRTGTPDVYAAGDCVQLRETVEGRRPIEAVWYVGRKMGETIGRTICGEATTYDPGIWFNSAKFFDLEWQVYGRVPARLSEDEATLFWQHPDEARSIRINYRRADRTVTGFNLMGVRYRHDACHHWLAAKARLRDVLHDLGAANFDPEFYDQYEAHVVAAYNREHPEAPLKLGRRRGLAGWIEVLRGSQRRTEIAG